MKLVMNQVGYKINNNIVTLYYSYIKQIEGFQRTIQKYNTFIKEANPNGIGLEMNFIVDNETPFYFSFIKSIGFENEIIVDLNKSKTLKRLFVKQMLADTLKKQFIINRFPTVGDLSIYKFNKKSDSIYWDKFFTYNLIVSDKYISIALASQSTLMSNVQFDRLGISQENISHYITENEVRHKQADQILPNETIIIANQTIKIEKKLIGNITRLHFKDYFDEISSFYKQYLSTCTDKISIYSNGFRELSSEFDYFSVLENSNIMKFGNDTGNVNIPNGMKYSGPYFVPLEKIKDLQFLFIYNDRKHANDLFRFLKDGLKHFPGLESYVKVPIRPNTELSLTYSGEEKLREEFDNYLQTKLPLDNYEGQFAIVILPFSKNEVTEQEDELYYYIKFKLLEKGIASQCIDYRRIYSSDFHFYLPNIAVAILAKIGGIPWKLDTKIRQELVIGFGEKTINDSQIIGNTVFFDNSGNLKKVDYITTENDSYRLASTIKQAILSYIKNENTVPERVIIHYYKALRKEERYIIDKALRDLDLNLPFVVLEINDSKAKDFMCFDTSFFNGMPISGTIVKLQYKNDFLLFNNSRYEENPRAKVQDEYPIKVRIHAYEGIDLTFYETQKLLSQVYEFSRLYWKSIRQQSLPVTTVSS